LTVLGLPPGNWAEWVGGVGTALAFGATSLAIWQGHRLRQVEHDEAMYDQALKVKATLGMGTEYVTEDMPDGTKQSNPKTKVEVTVYNSSRRPIHAVFVTATTETGEHVGSGQIEFMQAGWEKKWQFEPAEKSWGRRGPSSAITGLVTLSYEDIDGTAWVLTSEGRLLRARRPRGWRRAWRRFRGKPGRRPEL